MIAYVFTTLGIIFVTIWYLNVASKVFLAGILKAISMDNAPKHAKLFCLGLAIIWPVMAIAGLVRKYRNF